MLGATDQSIVSRNDSSIVQIGITHEYLGIEKVRIWGCSLSKSWGVDIDCPALSPSQLKYLKMSRILRYIDISVREAFVRGSCS